ncbi:MAG TPA: trehalose-6-phosphate synthase [bacterium]|nr:trehalose-6-phosphate synthase [bacterium]
MNSKNKKRLILFANRNPYVIKKEEGILVAEKTCGGLVTAIDPIMQQTGGVWMCWKPLDTELWNPPKHSKFKLSEGIKVPLENPSYLMKEVTLNPIEVNNYYNGYSNNVLWPLFHNFIEKCRFKETYWHYYSQVNEKFSESSKNLIRNDDLIWIHDYHFLLLPQMLRRHHSKNRIGFFLHIPFPPYEIFRILPQAKEILSSLLECDVIGFHIKNYVYNFINCVQNILKINISFNKNFLVYNNRKILIKDFPLGINTEMFLNLSNKESVKKLTNKIKKSLNVSNIGIGVDRLDFTKGILQRLFAIEHFFENNAEYRGKMSFVQIIVPSRTGVKEYKEMRKLIEARIAHINGIFGSFDWKPIHYFYRSYNQEQLISFYQAADFALITPIIDGMNLVAQEYVLCSAQSAKLILSDFAGAAKILNKAITVNPYNIAEVSASLKKTLELSESTAKKNHQSQLDYILKYNVFWWVKNFIEALKNKARD